MDFLTWVDCIGVSRELPSFPSLRLNILGFMSRDQQTFFQAVEGTVGSAPVVAAFDGFAAHYGLDYDRHAIPCVVALDNAPWHTSRDFRERLESWATQVLILHYLPPLSSYTSYNNLKKAVMDTLNDFGAQYQITFV